MWKLMYIIKTAMIDLLRAVPFLVNSARKGNIMQKEGKKMQISQRMENISEPVWGATSAGGKLKFVSGKIADVQSKF